VSVAEQVHGMSQAHINREKEINDFKTDYEIPSQLESATMRYPQVHGGSGFAASTVQDLGFEPTLGATGGSDAVAAKRRVRKKVIEVGEGLSAAGVAAAGISGGGAIGEGISGGAKPKRVRAKKGTATGEGLLSLRDLNSMQGQAPDTIQSKITVKAEGMPVGSGGAKGGKGKRNDIVREVMKKHGLSLPQASKFVKEHNLY
jgi:hypothetical protein